MYCIACGQELPEKAAFCWKCGTAVERVAGEAVGVTGPVPRHRPKGLEKGRNQRVDPQRDLADESAGPEDEEDGELTEAEWQWALNHIGDALEDGDPLVEGMPTQEDIEEELALRRDLSAMQQEELAVSLYGSTNPALVCPHCQTRGTVRVKVVKQKKGISGAKATGAVLTGGLSVLATGLSRKEELTQAHCDNCGSTWHF